MIVYFPLEHVDSRYTTHMDRDILEYFKINQIEYIYLEPKVISNEIKNGSFLDADNTLYRQFNQMQQLIEGLLNGTISKDSTLFITDIWNFGIMSIPYLNFFGNYELKIHGVLHAGSFTDTDFVRQMERYYKNFEDTIFDICDKIFVGSEFIKNDILKKRIVQSEKIIVTGLPMDFDGMNEANKQTVGVYKHTIVFNGRNVDEKQPFLFDLLQKYIPDATYINTQDLNLSKSEYYNVLKSAKIVLSFALQENFGYGIQEAVYLGCYPIVPNRLAYVEQFDKEYRYNTFIDAVEMVKKVLDEDYSLIPDCVNKENESIFKQWFKIK